VLFLVELFDFIFSRYQGSIAYKPFPSFKKLVVAACTLTGKAVFHLLVLTFSETPKS
jgi:hypothetical protein